MLKGTIYENLQIADLGASKFYVRAKIQRKDNICRPISQSLNCCTLWVSEYVVNHLQPVMKTISSHLKDTKDFMKKLQKLEAVPEDYLLITFDVNSLYTNRPNNQGIKAAQERYDKHKLKTVSAKVTLFIIFKKWDELWAQYQNHHKQIYLWKNLKKLRLSVYQK